jgi:hypothetical protein
VQLQVQDGRDFRRWWRATILCYWRTDKAAFLNWAGNKTFLMIPKRTAYNYIRHIDHWTNVEWKKSENSISSLCLSKFESVYYVRCSGTTTATIFPRTCPPCSLLRAPAISSNFMISWKQKNWIEMLRYRNTTPYLHLWVDVLLNQQFHHCFANSRQFSSWPIQSKESHQKARQ